MKKNLLIAAAIAIAPAVIIALVILGQYVYGMWKIAEFCHWSCS